MSYKSVSKEEFQRFYRGYPTPLETPSILDGEMPIREFYNHSLPVEERKVGYIVFHEDPADNEYMIRE